MKLRSYVVFDSVAEVFARPAFANTDAEAIRSFVAECWNADSKLGQSPEDYYLYGNGLYDDDNGCYEPAHPHRIMTGVEAVKQMRIKIEKTQALEREIAALHAESPGGTTDE